MPKRIVDGEGIWRSDKLRDIESEARAEYANLIPLADANGVFQADPYKVWSQVYSYNRAMEPEDVQYILDELGAGGLLFRWRDESDKTWGYWVGIDKPGRLPGPSRRGFNDATNGPVPDMAAVNEYIRNCRGTGLVYFIQAQESGRIKIGIAKQPRQRLSIHQTGSPERLTLLAVTPGGRELETQLHTRFKDRRLHGEWFECCEELKEFINTCASVDSTGFDDGIQKLLGSGVGLGIGSGLGQETEDMALKQEIMDKSREILGVRIFPGDSNWGEMKSLARVYGSENVISRFEQWAKTLQTPPSYPLTAFIRVADAIMSNKLQGMFPGEELSKLVNDISLVSGGQVIFNAPQRAAVARLAQEHTAAAVLSAFKEYWRNIESDDFAVRHAARNFTEGAEQLLYVQARRREKEAQTRALLAACTENEQRRAEEELAARLKAEEDEQDLIEDTL